MSYYNELRFGKLDILINKHKNINSYSVGGCIVEEALYD